MNEEENMALNNVVGEEANLDTTPVAEQQGTGEVEQTEVESAEETQEVATETEESRKSAGARIRELNQKAKAAEERARSLEEKVAELTGSVNPQADFNHNGYQQPQYNPQQPIVAPGEEIDAVELDRRIQEREQRILQQAGAIADLKHRQSDAVSRINKESSEVIKAYPELDPDSDRFNPELSDTIYEAVEAHIRVNPYSASVKTFVNKLMKPYKGAIENEVGQATENIAKQVSQAALRPSSIRKPEKAAAEKSIAELEATLGVVHS